jgi:hypothetical protein
MHCMMQEFPQLYSFLDALNESSDRAELDGRTSSSLADRDIVSSLDTIVNA